MSEQENPAEHAERIADAITGDALASAIADHYGHTTTTVELRASGTWLEAAAPTHGGHCDTCETQTTGPAWDWVEDGRVRGTCGDGQCGGCGMLGRGWVTTEARDLGDLPIDEIPAVVRALVAEAREMQAEAWEEQIEEISGGLHADLARMVEALEAGWEDLDDLIDESASTEPGVCIRAYECDPPLLVAWAWDPRHLGDGGTIEATWLVTAEDRARWAAASEAWLSR